MSSKRDLEEPDPNTAPPTKKSTLKISDPIGTTLEPEARSKNVFALWEKRVKELWIEALEITPLSFVDEIINEVNDHMYLMLSKIERFVSEYIQDEDEVAEKMTEIDVLLESAVDKNFDAFEVYALTNIFCFLEKNPVVPLHHEGIFSNDLDNQIEVLMDELKQEHEKIHQAELFAFKASQIQKHYQNFSNEIQEAVVKLELLASKVNQKDMEFLRSNLIYNLREFNRIFDHYKNSSDSFKSLPPVQHTQRDLYIQQSTLSSIADLLSTSKDTLFPTLDLPSDIKTVEEKPWTELLRVMDVDNS